MYKVREMLIRVWCLGFFVIFFNCVKIKNNFDKDINLFKKNVSFCQTNIMVMFSMHENEMIKIKK